MLIYTG